MVTRNSLKGLWGLVRSSRGVVLAAVVAASLGCGDNRGQGFTPEPDAGPRTDLGLPDGESCPAGRVQCGAGCVDTLTDRDHCGDCGQRCPDSQMCVQGLCQNECPQGQLRCDGVCVNLNTSQAHCGSCGAVCPQGLVCSLGRCEVECGPQFARCERTLPDGGVVADAGRGVSPYYCSDTRNDERNCGACGNPCPGGRVCEAGQCVAYCPPGQARCGDQCATLASSRDHCGACGNACTASQRCNAGACVETGCPPGTLLCMGRCIDIQSDSANCGACGTVCAAPQFCVAGSCALQCSGDRTACAGRCVDLQTDEGHCGMCGRACAAGFVCTMGACQLTCPMGTTVCAGRCVSTSTDRGHCGMCGTACGPGELCNGGACVAACAPSQTLCAGRCVDRQVDPGHCGTCGLSCGAGFACVAGVCRPGTGTPVPACAAPSRQCGTRCVDPRNDNRHCGACGMACADDRLCDNGTCVAPCAAGQDRCGGTCVDVRSNVTHCGRCGNACAMGMSCVNGACVMEDTFRIQALDAMGCVSIDHNDLTGDDRGPLAVSANRVFVTGDGTSFTTGVTVRFNADDVRMGATALSTGYDLMASDITAGVAYVFLNAMGRPPATPYSGQMITHLAPLDDDGTLGMARITLTPPLPLLATVGLFSGPSRILVHNGGRWFQIRMPSGAVEPVGPMTATTPTRSFCESSYWGGVAEFFDSELHVVYVTNRTTISRYRISDARITPVASFTSLSDACSLGVARARNRWYFHHEGSSQFATGAENLVSCTAQFGR